MPGATVVVLSSPSVAGGRGVSTLGGCWGASVGVGGMGIPRPEASGSACRRASSLAGLGVGAAAVVAVVVLAASAVVEETVGGGVVGACVLATVLLRGEVAGGSVGLEVMFAGPGNKIYF